MSKYNITDILKTGLEKFGNDDYIIELTNNGEIHHTYSEFVHDVYRFAGFLQHHHFIGKKIGIYSENCYRYMVSDAAIMGFVGTSVTFSRDWTAFELIRSIRQIGLDALIYSEHRQDVIDRLKEELPDICCLSMDETAELTDYPLPNAVPDTDVCAKIVFSSGTTGEPKAVMLSQDNMFENYDNLLKRAPMNHSDSCYLFLPLHHTYGAICTFLYSLISGMSLYLCHDTKRMMEEIRRVRPTVFCAVPLILERIYDYSMQNNIRPREILGGHIRYLFCGGAYLKPEIRKYFKNHDINLYEAYGLSETSSLISAEYPNRDDYESMGTVFESVRLKIDSPDADGVGEITVKGRNIFLGYCHNQEATDRAFDKDGYFHTGDLGRVKNNKLYYAGRIKRVIVLSNGENIYPDDIEARFSKYKGISRVSVFAREKKIVANIFISEECDTSGIVEEVNSTLPKYSRIHDYSVIKDIPGVRLK